MEQQKLNGWQRNAQQDHPSWSRKFCVSFNLSSLRDSHRSMEGPFFSIWEFKSKRWIHELTMIGVILVNLTYNKNFHNMLAWGMISLTKVSSTGVFCWQFARCYRRKDGWVRIFHFFCSQPLYRTLFFQHLFVFSPLWWSLNRQNLWHHCPVIFSGSNLLIQIWEQEQEPDWNSSQLAGR